MNKKLTFSRFLAHSAYLVDADQMAKRSGTINQCTHEYRFMRRPSYKRWEEHVWYWTYTFYETELRHATMLEF